MAGRGSSKWLTERARREKQAAKRERRESRAALPSEETQPDEAEVESADEAEVLEELARLHTAFADGDIPFEEFETAKERLVEQLRTD